jgi:hypothetical protein
MQAMNARIVIMAALVAGCTLNARVDVGSGTGQDPVDDSGSTTDEPAQGVTGDEPIGTTGEGEADVSTGAALDVGAGSTTGEEHTDCTAGTVGMVDHRCTCTLDTGETRAIDPAECACVLEFGPNSCTCDDVTFPMVSCGWECTAVTGSCLCGGFSAPTTWCGGEPVACEGEIEIDPEAYGGFGGCACSNHWGFPKEHLDPALCGCQPTADGCECGGVTWAPWVCGWPCAPSGPDPCVCGNHPAPLAACES